MRYTIQTVLRMNSMKIILSLFIIVFSIAVISCGSDDQNIESNVNVTDKSTVNEWSAGDLQAAALNGNLQAVREAIDQGVPVDEPDELGRTALMFAAYNGHTEVVNLLIDVGAEVNLKNNEGRTPLMFAASGPFPETVLLLLDEGADIDVQDSIEGWSALMYAAAEGNREVVKILLNHGADASLEDEDGETAIDFAESNGHTQTVTLLSNSLTQ